MGRQMVWKPPSAEEKRRCENPYAQWRFQKPLWLQTPFPPTPTPANAHEVLPGASVLKRFRKELGESSETVARGPALNNFNPNYPPAPKQPALNFISNKERPIPPPSTIYFYPTTVIDTSAPTCEEPLKGPQEDEDLGDSTETASVSAHQVLAGASVLKRFREEELGGSTETASVLKCFREELGGSTESASPQVA